jgi:outer membrane receptor protein involved in Fe transport
MLFTFKGDSKLLFFLLFLLSGCQFGGFQLKAQTSISGVVFDEQNHPVAFANVLLLAVADSSFVKGGIVSEDGNFSLSQIVPGEYFLKVFMIGYNEQMTAPFVLVASNEDKHFDQIILGENRVLMNEVQVIAKKPVYEQKIDRMIVNVANSITSSGNNALEVLERSPGVIVNRQNNTISMSGKSGVVVMINGRLTYMPTEAVTQLLEGMSADQIERIEIITTPPAEYDAEGNAGYVNIVLKSNPDDGFNGSYGFTAGYGKGAIGNANVNFNYRNGKTNLYGDYGYLHESQEQYFYFYRSIPLNGEQIETETESFRDPSRNNHTARLGLDYNLSQKTVAGVLFSGYDTKWEMDATNNATLTSNGILDTLIILENQELNQWKHFGTNVNLQHTFSEGKLFSMDFDYLHYNDHNPTTYQNEYYDGDGQFLFENYTRSKKETPINIMVGKLDYKAPLGKSFKMETGIKGSLSRFTNDVGVDYSNDGESWVTDDELTDKYDLVESIMAAYLSFDASLDEKTSLKLGLRYEFTDSNLGTEEEQDIVDRQFGELFPTFYISRTLHEDHSLNFSYSKRITRPTFDDMAPFRIFVDPYTFFTGNPALQPAISNNIELSYRYKSALLSVKYGIEDSTIANFQSIIIEGTNKQLIYAENLKEARVFSQTLSFPFSPTKWWNMFVNGGLVFQEATKNGEDGLETYEATSFNIFSSQTFTLPKEFTFEVSGFYYSGGLFGIFQLKPFGAVNLALQKKFGDRGGTLRLGYDDLFQTLAYSDELNLPEEQEYYEAYLKFAQSTIKLTYTRNFGNQGVKGSRSRSTGSEEERGRVNN